MSTYNKSLYFNKILVVVNYFDILFFKDNRGFNDFSNNKFLKHVLETYFLKLT